MACTSHLLVAAPGASVLLLALVGPLVGWGAPWAPVLLVAGPWTVGVPARGCPLLIHGACCHYWAWRVLLPAPVGPSLVLWVVVAVGLGLVAPHVVVTPLLVVVGWVVLVPGLAVAIALQTFIYAWWNAGHMTRRKLRCRPVHWCWDKKALGMLYSCMYASGSKHTCKQSCCQQLDAQARTTCTKRITVLLMTQPHLWATCVTSPWCRCIAGLPIKAHAAVPRSHLEGQLWQPVSDITQV